MGGERVGGVDTPRAPETLRGFAAAARVLTSEVDATWRVRAVTETGIRYARPPFNRVDPPRELEVPWIHPTLEESVEALNGAALWPWEVAGERSFRWAEGASTPPGRGALMSVAAYGPEMLRRMDALARHATPPDATPVFRVVAKELLRYRLLESSVAAVATSLLRGTIRWADTEFLREDEENSDAAVRMRALFQLAAWDVYPVARPTVDGCLVWEVKALDWTPEQWK